MKAVEVLVVGAGPTGLVLALWLTRQGVAVRIVDKQSGPATTSRALAVQARTLELYQQLGLADAVVSRGHKVPAVNLWATGKRKAHLDFTNIGAGLTPFAFLEIYPQDEHERMLIDALHAVGVAVERDTELLDLEDQGAQVLARLRHADGSEERCAVPFVAGCDGGHSAVRKSLGIGFSGGTYEHIFYVADVEASGPAIDGELHVDLDESDFVAVFPLADAGRVRLVGSLRDDEAAAQHPSFDGASQRAIRNLQIDVSKVNWFSTYRVHHRVADRFRKGRVFILGDAAHVHSPVGGQGMNTGIGDAINLAWKLASVLQGRGGEQLLASYEPERIEFARTLVATTDRAFHLVTAAGRFADVMRTRIVPTAMSGLVKLRYVRHQLFKAVSQTTVSYRSGPISQGSAGAVSGGDRLPWTGGGEDAVDNFADASELCWKIHVYGRVPDELAAWCEAHDVPLRVFAWQDHFGHAGLQRDALYLLRPDSYVGLVQPTADLGGLERYGVERGLQLGGWRRVTGVIGETE